MPHSTIQSPVHNSPKSPIPAPTYTPSYPRVSSFRSPQLEVLLYSPHVATEHSSWPMNRTVPIYADHDSVSGKIIMDPSCRSGRISLVLTGTFSVRRVAQKTINDVKPEPQRYIFFYASRTIEVTSDSAPSSPNSLRSVFRRKGRASTASFETRTFPFVFDLGQNHPEKMLPGTFCSSGSTSMPVELSYQLMATWTPSLLTYQSSIIQIPIILQPDPEFHSIDGSPGKQDSWLEIPLKAQRPVPVRCAITLPSTLTFSRTSSIPFFVVFTTTPRSASLAREIATDATISISVTSQFFWREEEQPSALDPTATMHSSDSRSSRMKRKVVKRMRSATTFWSNRSVDLDGDESLASSSMSESPQLKSLPSLTPPPPPPKPSIYSDTQLVHKTMVIGFPKRPRHGSNGKAHPSLDAHRSLPDGLFKDKIPLKPDMLPSINWGGITLKYFFEVSVSMGTDELKARVLLRIT
ncbi:hypothetical protein MIND_00137700 [Mycena indigotica]|uniref:Uncharacterized protein n=1 Tax=Mycena indigotica TaxID=2126181 RepID=A0A8H6TI74_9AGAR|nr:uncharacterized protein MIND_00137700 [Mycena indigotica]KAF7316195.1 hypothetical protein MIND_00137700 [Mycena indigotica]